MEAKPENVEGVIRETHSFEHQVSHSVNWGYVAVGIGLLVATYALFYRTEGREENREARGV